MEKKGIRLFIIDDDKGVIICHTIINHEHQYEFL